MVHNVVIDIDNNSPESSGKSEILLFIPGFFFKVKNCIVLCDIYPLRIFKILKICEAL